MRELERTATDTEAPDEAPAPIAVIGRGRVGGSLAAEAAARGLETVSAGRDDLGEACRGAQVALICVPDGAIGEVAALLADSPPPFVGHVSGATTLEPLEPIRAAGAETFSLHPLQTVPDASSPLTGAPAAIAGSTPAAESAARSLAEALGLRPFSVPDERRAAYHAAASIASNFLVALEQSAVELLGELGVDDPRELLAPLVLRSAANWAERGSEALTGPIARGDEATVTGHLDALREHAPELVPMYEAMAERTRRIADERQDR